MKQFRKNEKKSLLNAVFVPSSNSIDELESDGKRMKRKATYKHRATNCTTQDDPVEFENHLQRMLQVSAIRWRSRRFYGSEYDQITCICANDANFSWKEKSSGISWIGVNGGSTRCAVSMRVPPEVTFVRQPTGRTQLDAGAVLRTAVADMGDNSSAFRQRMAQSSRSSKTGVLAIVSVAPGTSSECPRALDAITFLMEKLKDRSSFTPNETEKIAVCALKYLLGPEFESNELEVCGSGNWSGVRGKMSKIKVEEHLDANKDT